MIIKLSLLIGGIVVAGIGMNAQETIRFEEVTVDDIVTPKGSVPAQVWSYDDCVARALESNTDLRATLLDILEADQDVAGAKDAWLPTVGFSTNHSFTNYPGASDGSAGNVYGSNYGINAAWTVWEGNVRKYRLETAKLMRQQQTYSGAETIKELRIAVLQSYLDILYAKEAVAIAEQTLEVSTSQAARAKRLMESGRSSRVDYAQIESQRAQDEYSVEQAKANLQSAKVKMKQLLNLGLGDDIEVAEVDFPTSEFLSALPEKTTVYDYALTWLPAFKSNDLSREIYAYDIKIAKAGYMPNIQLQGGVGTGYTSGGPGWGTQMWKGLNENVGVSLSVPIYDGNATKRAVAKANLAALEYDINRDRLEQDLSQTIETLYIDSSNAVAKYKAGESRLEAAQLTSDLTDRQFELGLVNPLELLTAHNNLVSARLEQLQNKYMAVLAGKTIEYYATSSITL